MATSKPLVVTQVEDEHHELRDEMSTLNKMLMEEIPQDDFRSWRLRFVWHLRDFKNRLLKHFDLEEDGGFMHDVIAAAPQSQRKVEELKEEHEMFAQRIDEIIDRARGIEYYDQAGLQELRKRMDALLAALREHENEEHRLIQRAYYREYGGPA